MVDPDRLPGRKLSPARCTELHGKGFKKAYLEADDLLIRETEISLDLETVLGNPFGWVTDPLGLLVGWRCGDTIIWQFRPDNPPVDEKTGRLKKYLFPKGSAARCDIGPDAGPEAPVVVVEGTKQHLAVASYLGREWTIVGIPGCSSWSGGEEAKWQAPPELVRLCARRTVYILADADAAENLRVYEDMEKLAKALGPAPKSVMFLPCPGGGTMGIDDYLAVFTEDADREHALRELLDGAMTKPAKRKPLPKSKKADGEDEDDSGRAAARKSAIERAMNAFSAGEKITDEDGNRVVLPGKTWMRQGGGLAVARLGGALLECDTPVATTPSGVIAPYKKTGVYVATDRALRTICALLLGDHSTPSNRAALGEYLDAICGGEGKVLPVGQTGKPYVNFRNGMLNLNTLKLHPHDPKYMSTRQLPCDWDPDAKCPTYDRWIRSVVGEKQVPIIEEAISQFLDESAAPTKALFLFGKSHSGKTTLIKLARAMVDEELVSAVSLQALSSDKFMLAELYGKAINCPSDMPKDHVRDTSAFKQCTGEDLITANRKYGDIFSFRSTAMFVMAANGIPTVSEESSAYRNRIIPAAFPLTFEGNEDDTYEKTMIQDELAGIARRWVMARHAHRVRRRWLAPVPEVAAFFGQSSDRVARFLASCCVIDGTPHPGPDDLQREKGDAGKSWRVNWPAKLEELHAAFEQWGTDEKTGGMGRSNFRDRLYAQPGVKRDLRGSMPSDSRTTNVLIRPHGEWGDTGGQYAETVGDLARVLFPNQDTSTVPTPTPEPAPNPTPEPTPENVTPITKAYRWSNPAPAEDRPARPSGRKRYWT